MDGWIDVWDDVDGWMEWIDGTIHAHTNRLIWANALLYNPPSAIVHEDAMTMSAFFEKKLADLLKKRNMTELDLAASINSSTMVTAADVSGLGLGERKV